MSRFTLHQGDSREVLKTLAENSVDAIVTDPPYGIRFMGQAWDGADIEARHATSSASERGRTRNGLAMQAGRNDRSASANRAFQEWTEAWAVEALRVLKPGGYLLCFAATRTYHRMTSGLEDAGFEIRDQIGWAFGSGFPKSHNGEWGGTALKPAWEPICMARKPLIGTVEANWLVHGTGALNIDACRIGWPDGIAPEIGTPAWGGPAKKSTAVPGQDGKTVDRIPPSPLGRWPANLIHDGSDEVLAAFPDAPGQLADISFTAPSPETSGIYGAMRRQGEASADSENDGAVGFKMRPGARRLDEGSAARFFYCAKAGREDRNEGCDAFERKALNWSSGTQNPGSFQAEGTDRTSPNFHPTVKPTDLMRHLCRLVTPKGGTVLDPFMGSGSTGKAAMLEGFNFIGIDLSPEYIEIARARIDFALRQGHQPSLLEAA